MSTLATVNRAIVYEARRTLRNSRLRLKDLREWSLDPITLGIDANEVVIKVVTVFGEFYAAFPAECDKRPS